MTLDDLGTALTKLEPGKYAAIHHDLFADLFPPGEPDDRARAACLQFASQHGCRIENKPERSELWFVKDAAAPR
jgi:hypothetical protein